MAPALGGRAVTAKRGCCLRGKPGLCGLARAGFCLYEYKSDNDPSEESSLEVESRAGAGAGAGALEGSRRGRFCRPPRASSGLASPSSPPAPPTMSGADSGRTRGAARLMAEHPKAASRIGPDFQVAPASIPPLPGAGAGGAEGGAAPEAAAAPAERSEGAPHAPAPARSASGTPGVWPGLEAAVCRGCLGPAAPARLLPAASRPFRRLSRSCFGRPGPRRPPRSGLSWPWVPALARSVLCSLNPAAVRPQTSGSVPRSGRRRRPPRSPPPR